MIEVFKLIGTQTTTDIFEKLDDAIECLLDRHDLDSADKLLFIFDSRNDNIRYTAMRNCLEFYGEYGKGQNYQSLTTPHGLVIKIVNFDGDIEQMSKRFDHLLKGLEFQRVVAYGLPKDIVDLVKTCIRKI